MLVHNNKLQVYKANNNLLLIILRFTNNFSRKCKYALKEPLKRNLNQIVKLKQDKQELHWVTCGHKTVRGNFTESQTI